MFEIDLDSETVLVDGSWLNRDDLAGRVRKLIDSGDYQIAKLSQALEALTKAVASSKPLMVRLLPETLEALSALAESTQRPMGAHVREAIAGYLKKGTSAEAALAAKEAGVETAPVSPEEAAHAVTLTPKRKDEEAPVTGRDVERRWFGR